MHYVEQHGHLRMDVNSLIAFSSGILSFFSPCVLPLLPSYLVFISGVAIDNFAADKAQKYRKIMFVHAISFVFGFSFIFVALGLSSSIIGHFFSTYQTLFIRIGGALLIIMGLFSLNIIRIPMLSREKVINLKEKPAGLFGAFIVGVAFSLGWTPCIGPALSSILLISSTAESMWYGAFLLSVYSLGLAIPFLISAVLFDRLLGFLRRYGYVVKYAQKIMGVLLIVVGLLLITSYLGIFSDWLMHVLSLP